ncbi:hypothetical protein EST38_g8692 [Candolleomyces aberdarensis]|uniref:DUF6533 domain-containing protein n=1 Tax=Candolleomyces aberdarensis TaxID=2316362 RepID=A0A4V1Q330_9AGAR|nr:hypothetical protein EST38_g8692 [Candolleomyces aberdarensis]
MATPSDGFSYDTIVRAYTSTRYVNYLAVSSFALVIVDFLHTFPDEVRLMWKAPMSLPNVLFFAIRYYSLVQGAFSQWTCKHILTFLGQPPRW